MIPYSRQSVDKKDIASVVKILKSNFLTQGPKVEEFEKKISNFCRSKYVVASNSATSSLHIACLALNLKSKDIVWTVPNTFVASANCAINCGAEVDFVDIDAMTFNICITSLEKKLVNAKKKGKLPKILIPVHFAGQPTNQNIKEIKNALKIIKKWHNKVILMYCVSSYPTKLEEIKFEKIDILRKKTGISNIGFSDHTKGVSAAIASISNGVRIVEKHFKLNGKNKSPDQIFSIDENDTRKLRVEFDKLDKIYSKTLNLESKNSLFFRRSIYAISNIKRNEKFTKKNIACYRPFTGLCASNFLNILGKKSKKTIKVNSVLKSKDF